MLCYHVIKCSEINTNLAVKCKNDYIKFSDRVLVTDPLVIKERGVPVSEMIKLTKFHIKRSRIFLNKKKEEKSAPPAHKCDDCLD